MKTAVIILGHGSRNGGADEAVQRIVTEVRKSGGYEIVEHAFLQYVPPSPQEALENCIRQHAEKIVIVPLFMQPGAHVMKDIPALVERARKQHPNIEIMVTDFAGSHSLMTEIVLDLVGKAK